MNIITRTNIKEKLVKAIEAENLLAQDVAAIFGMHPSYISWFKNPKYWDKIGETFWERVLSWINSGQKITEYAQKHGKTLMTKSPSVLKEAKTDTEKKETVSEPDKIEPHWVKSVLKQHKEKPIEEIKPQPRLNVGEMVNLLLEERASLKEKIEAIDVLLKHYIS
ncbi:MAG: hypothetical protein JJE45_00200 [Prolixibacteraceae bacterium]|nr:hypothetical protein [Prolixibacteraceae bacterium]